MSQREKGEPIKGFGEAFVHSLGLPPLQDETSPAQMRQHELQELATLPVLDQLIAAGAQREDETLTNLMKTHSIMHALQMGSSDRRADGIGIHVFSLDKPTRDNRVPLRFPAYPKLDHIQVIATFPTDRKTQFHSTTAEFVAATLPAYSSDPYARTLQMLNHAEFFYDSESGGSTLIFLAHEIKGIDVLLRGEHDNDPLIQDEVNVGTHSRLDVLSARLNTPRTRELNRMKHALILEYMKRAQQHEIEAKLHNPQNTQPVWTVERANIYHDSAHVTLVMLHDLKANTAAVVLRNPRFLATDYALCHTPMYTSVNTILKLADDPARDEVLTRIQDRLRQQDEGKFQEVSPS